MRLEVVEVALRDVTPDAMGILDVLVCDSNVKVSGARAPMLVENLLAIMGRKILAPDAGNADGSGWLEGGIFLVEKLVR